MEIIKLGEKVTIPGKNIRGEIAFIGETHFSDGTWFGVILDDPIGKHDGTVDGKRYFNCPRNHGMFIKATYFEKEYINIHNAINKPRKSRKHPNFPKASFKQKTEANVCTSQSINSRKRKVSIKNKKFDVPYGDNVINKEKTEFSAVAECGDNNCSDKKLISALKRYPNYLKASSKLGRPHFCSNLNKFTKTDDVTIISDQVTKNYEKRLMLPKECEIDENGNRVYKRIVYPNYLKASSKITAKRLCIGKIKDGDKAEHEVKKNVENNNAPKKSMEMQTQKECEENKGISDISASKVVRHQRPFSSFERSRSYSPKISEIIKANFHPKKQITEISSNNYIQDSIWENKELEEIKRENKSLKDKLERIEISLQEALNKYNKAQEEIKHLKYDNECQRKQIKYQRSHMKLLKMTQINNFKKIPLNNLNKNSNRNKMNRVIENTLREHSRNDTKNEDEKLDPERIKNMISTKHISELEEQNKVMVQGLVELRNFLLQCESQFNGLESSCSDMYTYSMRKKDKTDTFSYYMASPKVSEPKTITTELSMGQLNEYSEMLQEMTKYNELINENRRCLNDYEGINLDTELLGDIDSLQKQYDSDNNIHEVVETTNCSFESSFDTNNKSLFDPSNAKMNSGPFESPYILKKTGVQSGYHTAINRNSQYLHNITTKNNKISKLHNESGVSHEFSDNTDKLKIQFSTEEPNEGTSILNIPEQDILEQKISAKNSNSIKSEIYSDFSVGVLSLPKSMSVRSSDDSS